MDIPFASLHNHSMFSCLDGISKPKKMVARALELGYQAMALTDHGTMAGCIQFYQECKKQGLQPILGFEAYICPDISIRDKESLGHITLLAKNYKGYQNLLRLVSKANGEGFYIKPRIDWKMLAEHGDGVIALSGCLGSPLHKQIVGGIEDEYLLSTVGLMRESCEGFFFETMNSSIPEQMVVHKKLVELSKKLSIPIIATTDSHYELESHFLAQTTARAIDFGKLITENGVAYSSNEYWIKSWNELLRKFDQSYLINSILVSEMVDIELPLRGVQIPKFQCPDQMGADDFLRRLIAIGWQKKGIASKKNVAAYRDRLSLELADVAKIGLQDYFLIVWDIIRFCDENQIPRGDGRGSAAGSLILYLLGVTRVDPIQHNLYWERFYNAGRGELKLIDGESYIQGSMPDVDLDLSFVQRGKVLGYLASKYQSASKLCTFSTLSARQVIRDAGKAFGMSEIEVSRLTELVPKQAYKVELKEFIDTNEHVKALSTSTNPTPCGRKWSEFFDVCRVLEGCYRHPSIHASAVIVANRDINGLVPMVHTPDQLAVGYEMEDAESVGLVKIDLLGIRSLDIVEKTIQLAEEAGISEDGLFESNVDVWKAIVSGDTSLMFQLDSNLGSEVARAIRPRSLQDISDCIALQRPGPGNLLAAYCEARRSGVIPLTGQVELDEILHSTYGQLIYQEQVIKIANQLAGYDLKGADQLRKVLGKKEKDKIQFHREKFVAAYKYGKESGTALFNQIERFADYSFNFAHSISYAMLTWKTAWLKVMYPVQFYLANLVHTQYEQDPQREISKILVDAKSHGIRISAPSIHRKNFDFEQIDGKTIAFGLYHLRNIGEKARADIEGFKAEGQDQDGILRFCRGINKRVAESLIKSGCFDLFADDRIELYYTYQLLLELTDKEYEQLQGHITLETLSNPINYIPQRTIKRRGPIMLGKAEQISKEFLADQRRKAKTICSWELETMGFASSYSLMESFSEDGRMPEYRIRDLPALFSETEVSFIGQVQSLRKCLTRRNKEPMALGIVQDDGFQANVVFFPQTWAACQFDVSDNKILFIKGRKKENSVIVSEAKVL